MRKYTRMSRPGFVLYHEDMKLLRHVNARQFKAFMTALADLSEALEKGEEPDEPDFDGMLEALWNIFARKVERQHEEYSERCRRNQQNRSGATRGDDRHPVVLQTETKTETKTKTKTEAEAKTEALPEEAAKAGEAPRPSADSQVADPAPPENAFTPPSPQEVNAFCASGGFAIDAQRFCDFYASKGWMVGNQPMRDWQAAVRTWVSREKSPRAAPVKQLQHQQYRQREYVHSTDETDAMMASFLAQQPGAEPASS